MRATNPREVGLIFREYARKIHAKASPSDPSFIRISVACGKVCSSPSYPVISFSYYVYQIESWCEHNYPSFVVYNPESGKQSLDPSDARTRIVMLEQSRDAELAKKKRAEDKRNGVVSTNGGAGAEKLATTDISMGELMMYVGSGFVMVLIISLGILYAVLKYTES